MARLKRDANGGSTSSSLDDSSLSSPSTTTTPTITVREIGGEATSPSSPTEPQQEQHSPEGVNQDTYTITDEAGGDGSTNPAVAAAAASDSNGQVKRLVQEQEEEGDGVARVPPPDGGWGWVVVFSSFLIHVIADGVVYTFGIFLMEFVDVFKVGRGPASWIGALQPAVTFTVGPLASALTNRYGCRAVTIVGAIIAGLGFIISVPAPNLYYLYVTCGVMTGLGFGLIYLPAIVSVAQYFEKKRSFATGLAVCGSGFGTFILAPITEMLVHEYSWRGAMLILGGIILNVIVCGLLFRPLVGPEEPETDKTSLDNSHGENRALLSSSRDSDGTTTMMMKTTTTTGEMIPMITATTPTTKEEPEMTFLIKKHHGGGGGEWEKNNRSSLEVIALTKSDMMNGADRNGQNFNKNHQVKSAPAGGAGGVGEVMVGSDTDILISSIATEHEDGHNLDDLSSLATSPPSDVLLNSFQVHVDFPSEMDDNLRELSASQCLTVPGTRKNGTDPASLARSDGAIHRRFHKGGNSASNGHGHNKSPASPHDGSGGGTRRRVRLGSQSSSSSNNPHTLAPLSRKDIFYSGSLLNIPMYRSQPDVYLATVTPVSPSHHHGDDTDAAGGENDEGDGKGNKCFEFSREFRSTMREMMSFSLLRNPVFLMFGISNFLTSIGFNMPFIFLPDRATLAGIDENDAAYLLSIIGIANTCGRIIFGFLSDRSWVNRLFLYNSALTICGVATAMSVMIGDSYAAFVAYAAIFGVFIGVYVSLTSVVLVDLLGLEYLTNSFGLLLLFQGAATFVGPPIAGMLYDWTGSYDISFIVMGTLIAVSGAMLFLLPCLQRHYNRQVPVVEIVREVEMGMQIQGDSEMAEIIRSREVIPHTSSSHSHSGGAQA